MDSSAQAYEQICNDVSAMDRGALTDSLLHFTGDLPLDFSPDYLSNCTTERMQHLLVAALWRCYVKHLSSGLATHVCA